MFAALTIAQPLPEKYSGSAFFSVARFAHFCCAIAHGESFAVRSKMQRYEESSLIHPDTPNNCCRADAAQLLCAMKEAASTEHPKGVEVS